MKSKPKHRANRYESITVAEHLKRMEPHLRSIVREARRAVRQAAPMAREQPYQSKPPRAKSSLWKIARYVVGDADVVGIALSSVHAVLYFYRGAELDDGSGLLDGGGKSMRFIRLTTPRDALRPEVRRMLQRAFSAAVQ
jgi:hypothetical protein